MKAILTLLASVVALSMDMHRNLEAEDEDVNKVQEQLFALEKKDLVAPKFTIAPELKLVSPMQRFVSHVTPKDSDGNDVTLEEPESDLNPHL